MRIKIYLGGIEILVNLVYLENLDVLGGSGKIWDFLGMSGIFWEALGFSGRRCGIYKIVLGEGDVEMAKTASRGVLLAC